MSQTLMSCTETAMGYGKRVVLHKVNLAINQGEILGIIGPNGAGKTTLLKTLLGLLPPLCGSVYYPTGRANIKFGFVPQRQVVDETYPLTVSEIVCMGRYGLVGPGRRLRPIDDHETQLAIAEVGLTPLADRLFRELSGGQKQRILLARALAAEPNVLVLDEPTTDMDVASERAVIELVDELQQRRGLTVLVVSHLLHVVLNLSHHIALVNGTVEVHPIADVLQGGHLDTCYGAPIHIGQVNGIYVTV